MLLTTEEIKNLIKQLSIVFKEIEENDTDDLNKVEEIESEVQELILDFAFKQGYISENQIKDINDRTKFLDLLSVNNSVIGDLNWYYVTHFYPDFYESQEEFLEMCKVNLDL